MKSFQKRLSDIMCWKNHHLNDYHIWLLSMMDDFSPRLWVWPFETAVKASAFRLSDSCGRTGQLPKTAWGRRMLLASTPAASVLFLCFRACCMCTTSSVGAFNAGKFYLCTAVSKTCLEGLLWTMQTKEQDVYCKHSEHYGCLFYCDHYLPRQHLLWLYSFIAGSSATWATGADVKFTRVD